MKSQEARSAETRGALLAAGRRLFARGGFRGTGIEAVAGAAGNTTGALYHHFRDKQGLFQAVFEEVERELAERVAAAAAGGADPWDRLLLGIDAYLAACASPALQRIVLTDAPSVLGWETWREIDARYHLRSLRAALAAAMRARMIESRPPEPLAQLLMGMLTEAGLAIARGEDPELREAVAWLVGRLRL